MAIRRKPRLIRQQKTYDNIVDVAERLLIENGRGAFSLRKVAAAASYSPAGLYEYFASKDALINAVRKTIRVRLSDALKNARHCDNPIHDVCNAYVRFAVDNPSAFLLVFGEVGEQDSESQSPATLFVNLLTQLYPTVSSRLLANEAYTLWSAIHGVAMLNITEFRATPADAVTQKMIQRLVKRTVNEIAAHDQNSISFGQITT